MAIALLCNQRLLWPPSGPLSGRIGLPHEKRLAVARTFQLVPIQHTRSKEGFRAGHVDTACLTAPSVPLLLGLPRPPFSQFQRFPVNGYALLRPPSRLRFAGYAHPHKPSLSKNECRDTLVAEPDAIPGQVSTDTQGESSLAENQAEA